MIGHSTETVGHIRRAEWSWSVSGLIKPFSFDVLLNQLRVELITLMTTETYEVTVSYAEASGIDRCHSFNPRCGTICILTSFGVVSQLGLRSVSGYFHVEECNLPVKLMLTLLTSEPRSRLTSTPMHAIFFPHSLLPLLLLPLLLLLLLFLLLRFWFNDDGTVQLPDFRPGANHRRVERWRHPLHPRGPKKQPRGRQGEGGKEMLEYFPFRGSVQSTRFRCMPLIQSCLTRIPEAAAMDLSADFNNKWHFFFRSMIFIYVKLTVFTRVFEGGKVHLTLRSIDSISRDSKNATTLKLDIFGSHFGHFVRK